jgi:hypothetical protein
MSVDAFSFVPSLFLFLLFVVQPLATIRHTDTSRDCVWLQMMPVHEPSFEATVRSRVDGYTSGISPGPTVSASVVNADLESIASTSAVGNNVLDSSPSVGITATIGNDVAVSCADDAVVSGTDGVVATAATTIALSPGVVIASTNATAPAIAVVSDIGATPVPLARVDGATAGTEQIVFTGATSPSAAAAVSEFIDVLVHQVVATSSSSTPSCVQQERQDPILAVESESQSFAAAVQAWREDRPPPVIVEASVSMRGPTSSSAVATDSSQATDAVDSLASAAATASAAAASFAVPAASAGAAAATVTGPSNLVHPVANGTRVRVIAVAALRGFAYVEVVSREYMNGWVPQQHLQYVVEDLSLVTSSRSSSSTMATCLVDLATEAANTSVAKPTAAAHAASAPRVDSMARVLDEGPGVPGNINAVIKASIEQLFVDPSLWQKDDQTTECRACQSTFSVWLWKHHCRMCGCIFCDECSKQKIAEQRVCDRCFDKVQAQSKGPVRPQSPPIKERSDAVMASSMAAPALQAEPVPAVAGVCFFVVGGLGHGLHHQARALGLTMAAYARAHGTPDAIVGLGNNFSSADVARADDVACRTAWMDPFLCHPELQVPWHVSLGPRDHSGDVQAQIECTHAVGHPKGLWNMPARTCDFAYPSKSCPLTFLSCVCVICVFFDSSLVCDRAVYLYVFSLFTCVLSMQASGCMCLSWTRVCYATTLAGDCSSSLF